ncbi:MAG TPA: hypothetical protein VK730_13645 [Solirubrobacteraceae bacterium]|jgi:hypothetical protein|nr:hypothetical protein [Solirubrobacteraceae bacterium]
MLETFSDIVEAVLQYGFNDGPQVNRTRIKNWVNEAQVDLARQVDAPEFQETQTIVMVLGQYQYTLPADFLRVQDIVYELLSSRLKPVDQQQFDLTAPALVQGPPEIYTLYQSQLWVYPGPNSTDPLLMRYLQRPPTLVNDGDVPVLNQDYLQLMVMASLAEAFAAEDDIEASQFWQGKYEKARDAYASDVQDRMDDRPRLISGTWGGSSALGR